MGALDGKTAIITGGGSGIGFAIAERFVKEGANVVLAGRSQKRLDEAVEKLGRRARGMVTDVADEAQVQRLIDSEPRIDLLVTCAGGAVFGPVEQVPTKSWRELFDGRFFGQLSACHHAVPKMPPGSSIVLCSGIAGHAALVNYSGGAGLCGAVNAMGRSLAVELAPKGIRVNVLSPGLTHGTAIDWKVPPEKLDEFMAGLMSNIPMKRSASAHEMADAAFFLATCTYATGMVLDIDGGWTAI
ncbi:SDR family oxidoreductase [Archangium violaceum]|jgi:NAD(P)-dependent dehydrogenase (short-subunit alcohol dehydrogenase family)|uniref:SDR family NAD(P)-dependent oxidoreductase n=1 Tax=Archangium violaceum TaxID=83451 RepID=UPI00194E926F|nr:SDR family oxidoreductase [Archangium violaceum]QRO02159.1 SDR family oxidoreductase [Archangium violaceum]